MSRTSMLDYMTGQPLRWEDSGRDFTPVEYSQLAALFHGCGCGGRFVDADEFIPKCFECGSAEAEEVGDDLLLD